MDDLPDNLGQHSDLRDRALNERALRNHITTTRRADRAGNPAEHRQHRPPLRRDLHAFASRRKTRLPHRRESRAPRRTRLLGRGRDPLPPRHRGSLSIPSRLPLSLLLDEGRARLHRLAISAERLPGLWKGDARIAGGFTQSELGTLLEDSDAKPPDSVVEFGDIGRDRAL